MIRLPSGEVLKWSVSHNLCDDVPEKVKALRKFLVEPATAVLADRVVVVTHCGLAAAFKRMTPAESTAAIRNTTFAIDEAHHVQAADEAANQLGEVVSFILQSGDPTVRIILATAFFFRGDRLPILPEEHFTRFRRLSIPFDRYWNSLKHLKAYRYDFVAYSGTVWSELDRLLADSQEPTIIYCPPEGHRLLLGKPKSSFTERVVKILSKHYDAEVWQPDRSPSKPVILDLVDTKHRAEKVQFAMRHGDRIAVILSVGMFREGADWIQAQRVIDLIPSGSDQDRNQRFGRLIRDYPGKTCVSYYSLFPRIADEEQRKDLTKLFAHFHASLIFENALVPIQVPRQMDSTVSEDDGRRKRINPLAKYDAQEQEGIMADCHEALMKLAAKAEATGGTVGHEDVLREFTAVLQARQIEEHLEPLAKQIVLILRRRANLNLPVEDLVEAGFDKVWASDVLEGLRLYSAGFGGPATFREIRRAVRTVIDDRWFEMYEQLRQLPAPPPTHTRARWWVRYHRQLQSKGLLSRERVELLESIPWWTWRAHQAFRDLVRELASLSEEPPARTRLYQFTWRTRKRHKNGRLSKDAIEQLEAIPWWSWDSTETAWNRGYESIAKLPETPRHLQHRKEYKFAYAQKEAYKKGKLPQRQIELLEAIPWWSWESQPDAAWNRGYESIARLPQPPHHKHHPKEYRFGHWQKRAYRTGSLSRERAKRLEAIQWWEW